MDPEVQVQDEQAVAPVEDRRAAIEAAFEAAEPEDESAPKGLPEAPIEKPGRVEPAIDATQKVDGAKQAELEETVPAEKLFNVDKAPQSWRAPQKAKWATLDSEVRQEVIRREREITKTLGESAQARQFANQFVQTVQPYQARFQAMGTNPMAAIQQLLKADYLLTTTSKAQRAQLMSQLIKDYDVDIRALDDALAGSIPQDTVETRVEQLLQQRLAPFQNYMAQQQYAQEQREHEQNKQIGQTIEQMADNPQFPYFDDVREDMADLIDIAAKHGKYLTLEQAYSRATTMNPEVSKLVATQQSTEARRHSATQANAQAQKALSASVSVGGAPSSTPTGAPVGSNRRAAIEAAFEAIGGR